MKFTIAIASIFAISQAGIQGEENNCYWNEAFNMLGPHQCYYDWECTGARTCSEWKWCTGETNCVNAEPAEPEDPTEQLQLEVDGLEQDIDDINRE